jgi:YVTN family beta-propeller protein
MRNGARISMEKTLRLICLAALIIALATGCNDSLRQFIIPLPQPGGDTSGLAHAIVLSTNPVAGANGSDLHIDVSGDSVVGVVNTGPDPQYMVKGTNRVFILNGDNTITSYIALLPLSASAPAQIITQPTSTMVSGSIGGGFSSTGSVYIANSGSANTSMIPTNASAITAVVGVGAGPVAIAGNGSNDKIYVVNHTSGTVTPISTLDNSVFPAITVGTSPIWAVMSNDGVHVFVVNQGGNSVSVIDTLLDIVIKTVLLPAGAAPNYAVYDSKLQRLYVSDPGINSISVIDASQINLATQTLPQKIADIPVSGSPISVAALADGSRVYAALGNCPAGTNQTNIIAAAVAKTCTGNSVSVIDAISLKEKKVIPVGAGAISIDAAGNSSKVYVVNAIDRTVSIISTVSDTVTSTLSAPKQSLGCVNPAACPQDPQIPFLVRVFP